LLKYFLNTVKGVPANLLKKTDFFLYLSENVVKYKTVPLNNFGARNPRAVPRMRVCSSGKTKDPMIEMNTPTKSSFGYQLLLDLYGCKPGVCDDLELNYRFLDEIVNDLGMAKQSPPYIFRSPAEQYPDKAGLSGWAPLIESSVVIHTLTVTNFISIDIYCCRFFDTEMAKKVCQRFFGPKKIDEQFIERGLDYYKCDTNYHTVTVDKREVGEEQVTIHKK
jgi:S-adenosylmethionine decarboxylase